MPLRSTNHIATTTNPRPSHSDYPPLPYTTLLIIHQPIVHTLALSKDGGEEAPPPPPKKITERGWGGTGVNPNTRTRT